MPQFAVIIYAPVAQPETSGTAAGESVQEADGHDRHADELIDSGAMVAAFALHSAKDAVSLHEGAVTDGPYAETKELIAGIYVIEADDRASALRIAGRNPANRHGGGVEVRQVQGSYLAPPAAAGETS